MSDLHALRHLLRAYLNQDWPDDYASVWEGVAAFEHDEPDLLPELRSELAEITATGKSEEALRRLLVDELGGGYWPPGDGMSFAEWLSRLRARLD